ADLALACMELMDASWKKGKPIRLLAVTAMKLVPKNAEVTKQVTLFDSASDTANREKEERLELAMDRIREKYGEGSITTAGIAFSDIGIHDGHGEPEEE
ncbi:MAG TPA: hypothetical protein PKE04_19370, partial [Clostridia bacterium]|nr:hypothetical protein [Clostridia bacterium]